MEFWLGLYGMQSPRTHPRSHVQMYADLLEHAAEAERLGFDGFGLTEHHFWYDGYCPSLLPVLAAIARRTRRIRLVPCALLLPLHEPRDVAAQAAIVDHLSRGRLSLAFGYGYRTEEYEGFGLEMKARGTRVSRAIEAVREGFQAFEPFQKPCPPLWLAGGSQAATARRAGRLGVHYWAPGVGLQHAQVGALVSEYRRAGAESGFAPHELRVGIATDVAIAETREEAQRIVSEDVLPVYAEQLVAFGFIRDADGKPIRALPPDHPIFQVLLGSFVVGTPDDVIAGIERYRALGCDVFMPRLVEANFRGSRILGEMRLFAETVIPHFAGMRPS